MPTYKHTPGSMPVPPATIVQVDLGDGEVHIGRADEWNWETPGDPDMDGEGRIHGYDVLVPEVPSPAASRCRTFALMRRTSMLHESHALIC